MKYIIDTNILFSALYDMDSNAGKLLMLAIEGDIKLLSTEDIKSEMKEILVKKLNYSQSEVDELIKALPIEWIERGIYDDAMEGALKLLPDEADASLIACASLFHCVILTGDKKILSTKFKKVRVQKLRDAIEK
ncbi:MAG: PIN domain-containing protein [Candidatus Thermoplasmatota archaeon]